jgi:hypothetical protein
LFSLGALKTRRGVRHNSVTMGLLARGGLGVDEMRQAIVL